MEEYNKYVGHHNKYDNITRNSKDEVLFAIPRCFIYYRSFATPGTHLT